MRQLRNVSMWFLLLSKRLYKKPSFLVILLLVPVLVFGYSLAAGEESGMQTVVLACENPKDPLAAEISEDLSSSSELIRFLEVETPEEARQLVQTGKADCAWIFPADTEAALRAYLASPSRNKGFVEVVCREETVPIRLSLEKLSGELFIHCARFEYLRYMQENATGFEDLSEEEILAHFDDAIISDQLFSYSYIDGTKREKEDDNYLMAPVRGLMGVLIVLCGLSTAMYYMQDQRHGLFAWVPERKRPLVELGVQVVSLVNISAAAFLTLALAGQTGSLGRELLVSGLYILCCASFSQAIRSWLGSIKLVGAALPLLTVLMIGVSPVFFDLAILRRVQFLLPPTYYVNAVYNGKYILYMLLFTAICWGLSFLGQKLRHTEA